MTIVINLSPELEEQLRQKATHQGQGVFIFKNAIAIFKKNHKIFRSNSL
ncbi:hypothetical protein [Planktothrix sp.]